LKRLPDAVLELLEDGRPHSRKEIAEKKKLTLKELDRVLEFLTKYGFVAMLGNYVEINPEFQSLLKGP
jgi:predicted transcriptional regulator